MRGPRGVTFLDSSFVPSILAFLLAERVKIASIAQSVMAAYYPATFWASPLCGFFFQEPRQTVLSYELEVLDHAHVVKSAIALIESLDDPARKIPAFMTEPHQPAPNQPAPLFVMTVLAARQAARAVRLPESFLPEVVLHRQVAAAYAAVHPTGSDKFFFHFQ